MFSFSIVQSVVRTLLLALAASGRSVGAHEFAQSVERKLNLLAATEQAQYTDDVFHFTLTAPKGWAIDPAPVMHPAIRVGITPNLGSDEERKTSTTYIKVAAGKLQQPSLQEYVKTSLHVYSEMWAVETSDDITFLGAPAKDLLLRQHIGDSTTKIRKIFTVRKTKDATNVLVLSFSAPPDDYDRMKPLFDEALECFSFSDNA